MFRPLLDFLLTFCLNIVKLYLSVFYKGLSFFLAVQSSSKQATAAVTSRPCQQSQAELYATAAATNFHPASAETSPESSSCEKRRASSAAAAQRGTSASSLWRRPSAGRRRRWKHDEILYFSKVSFAIKNFAVKAHFVLLKRKFKFLFYFNFSMPAFTAESEGRQM